MGKLGTSQAYLWILTMVMTLSSCSMRSSPPGPNTAAGVIEGAGYALHLWPDSLAILIFHDTPEGLFCEGEGGTSDPMYRLVCTAESKHGTSIEWEVQTSDGATAQIWIGGSSYDLSDGALFLIRSQNGRATVTQLKRDLSGLTFDHESISAYALADEKVSDFIHSIGAK